MVRARVCVTLAHMHTYCRYRNEREVGRVATRSKDWFSAHHVVGAGDRRFFEVPLLRCVGCGASSPVCQSDCLTVCLSVCQCVSVPVCPSESVCVSV